MNAICFDPSVDRDAASRAVTIVSGADRRRELLACYLEAHGWAVRAETNGRRALRRWAVSEEGGPNATPFLFIDLEPDDLDGFELLAGVAAHLISPQVLCASDQEESDLRVLGVHCVVPARARFADILRALGELHDGVAIRAA